MKKSLLSLSIGAFIGGLTLAGAANAAVSIIGTGTANGVAGADKVNATTAAATLELNQGGIGHIGIIPYFSTQNGNQTLISITNTDTTNGKAVKVRFRSAANSDDVFDFTLFLSPGDVWTANISKDAATGLSKLLTTDNSCTLPATADLNRNFITDRLPAVTTAFTADTRASWTREGYVEVLNMADIPPFLAADGTTANATYNAVKHSAAGVPTCDSTQLAKFLVNLADEKAANTLGLNTPTTGLYTNSFIINTANAFMAWSTESTAVQAQNGNVPARGRIVLSPQTNAAATGTVAALTADPLLAQGLLAAQEFDFPDLSTPYVDTTALATSGAGSPSAQAERLTGSLAVQSVKNDYSTLAAIGSKTDFTFSMPTRRYHAAVNYASGLRAFTTPFVTPYFTNGNTSLSGNLLCVAPGVAAAVTGYDRSERFLSSGAVVSPGQAASLQFCGEVSVLTINNDANSPSGKGVLGATVAVQNVFTSYQEGWINIQTPGLGGGLPVLGSAYTSAVGAPANGVSTNFGWTFKHKTTK